MLNWTSLWTHPIEVPLGMVLVMVVALSVLLTLQCSQPHNRDDTPSIIPKVESESVPTQTTITTAKLSSTVASPTGRRGLSSYRMEEERPRGQSSALSRRGELWTRKATWHLPQAPLTSTRQHEMYNNCTGLDQIKALLSSFQVDPFNGFLPAEDPLQRLPYARYHLWEDLADDIPKLLGARLGQVREPLRQLPVLSTDRLTTEAELRRAHLLLCVFAHAYVWGGNSPMDVIPEGIAKPLWEVSQRLGIPPVLSHTSLVLYNWRRLDSHADICMENLSTLNNFFNGRDESWFYLITAELEAKGGNCVIPMMLAMDAIRRLKDEGDEIRSDGDVKQYVVATKGYELYEDTEEDANEELLFTNEALTGELSSLKVAVYVNAQLHLIAQAVQGMHESLMAMREGCHPFIFYHRVRPFLSGWKHNPTLPNGVLYEGVSEERQQFFGGSAAQSPLLPFLDIGMGIEHHSSKSYDFLLAMRDYMLKSHREFLIYMEREACIRAFVLQQLERRTALESQSESLRTSLDTYTLGVLTKLQQSYDECVYHLQQFRTGHISIVAEYILAQQKDHSGKKGLEDAAGGKGTGGTELMKFLKPLRDDCTEK